MAKVIVAGIDVFNITCDISGKGIDTYYSINDFYVIEGEEEGFYQDEEKQKEAEKRKMIMRRRLLAYLLENEKEEDSLNKSLERTKELTDDNVEYLLEKLNDCEVYFWTTSYIEEPEDELYLADGTPITRIEGLLYKDEEGNQYQLEIDK